VVETSVATIVAVAGLRAVAVGAIVAAVETAVAVVVGMRVAIGRQRDAVSR